MSKVQALLVRVESDSGSSNYKHMRAKFVWIDSQFPPNGSNYACQHGAVEHPDSYGETYWANELEANSQASVGESKFYGMELRYRTYSCGLRDCERMFKTLKSLEGKLDKFAEIHDYAKDVTEYMFRLALVTKCKYIVLEEPNFSWRFKAYTVDNYGKRAIERLREGNSE